MFDPRALGKRDVGLRALTPGSESRGTKLEGKRLYSHANILCIVQALLRVVLTVQQVSTTTT